MCWLLMYLTGNQYIQRCQCIGPCENATIKAIHEELTGRSVYQGEGVQEPLLM